MNSHQRRVVERKWPYCVTVSDEELADQCLDWLKKNMGSCSFAGRRWPRWCWRPEYTSFSNFSVQEDGVQVYFRSDKDYAWFMLKWDR